MTNPDVDRLVSASVDIFELVKPSKRGLAEPNWRHIPEVSFKYQSIHSTAFHCSLPGLLINRLTTLIAYLISSRIHTIAFIKLPTAEAYGIFIISAFSAFVFGLCFPDNLQLTGSANPTSFASHRSAIPPPLQQNRTTLRMSVTF